MKAVILAGGLGTRLSEETVLKPKPMVEIAGKPILWHIMKIYSFHGINDFIICCGYKGSVIKEYFANYALQQANVTFDLQNNTVDIIDKEIEPWRITLINTGEATQTGGRLLRVKDYLSADEDFCFTYGDGVADVDINKLIQFHKSHDLEATLTAVLPPGRFGALEIDNNKSVNLFREKPRGDGAFVNGGFFVLNASVLSRIEADETVWEEEPLRGLANDGQLMAFEHTGFWQPMDTLRDKELLQRLWERGDAPWKVWK